MALRDPVAVYNANDNFEAQLVCKFLNDAAVEAYVTEDLSPAGVWMFGFLPEIHKPQVWVDRGALADAKPLLQEYEDQKLERMKAGTKQPRTPGGTVKATCEECGGTSVFPEAQAGTTQDCQHCGAYVDV